LRNHTIVGQIMDGRLSLVLAGGLFAAVGCNSTSKRPGDLAQAGEPPTAKSIHVASNVPPPPAEPQRTNLKPSTYLSMGALTEQAAEETERPQAERDGFRHQARQSYQKALQVDPKYAPAYIALGASYMAEGDRAQAQAMFQKAIELAPNDAALWSDLGTIQAKGKDWTAAITSYSRAAQLDPGNRPLETRLGLTLARAGRYEDSLNVLAKVMPEAEARYNVARMMKHNGEDTAADVQIKLALKADPSFELARQLQDDGAQSVQQAAYNAPVSPTLPPVQLGGR
jgi:tetratricopeptide (TPR) repeat protein